MTSLRIGPCTAADLAVLLADAPSAHLAAHHRERFALQGDGRASYLLAWQGRRNVGRTTLYPESKYESVRALHPRAAEINALAADPPGQGTGTALIAAAEAVARRHGHPVIGLAVEPSNPRARSLYERLGYLPWGHGQVIDEWTETRPDRTVEHRDPCDYLVKDLGSAP